MNTYVGILIGGIVGALVVHYTTPRAHAQSEYNWENSSYNWKNSEYNFANSSDNWKNSPYNWKNSEYNFDNKNGI